MVCGLASQRQEREPNVATAARSPAAYSKQLFPKQSCRNTSNPHHSKTGHLWHRKTASTTTTGAVCVCVLLRVSVRGEAKYTRSSLAKLLFLGREFGTTVSENTPHVWGTRMKPSAVKTVWKNYVFFAKLKSTQWHYYLFWENFIIGAWYCHSS